MKHSTTETERHGAAPDAGPLRAALAEAAYEINPSQLPLAAIERDGRRRRFRRRAAVLAAGCGLLVAPLAVVGVWGSAPDAGGRVTPPAASASPSPSASSITVPKMRVVTPGEHVAAAPGTSIWLTQDGMHWTAPEQPQQFKSVVDGNIARDDPNVTLHSTSHGRTEFLLGVYTGKGDAAGVRIKTPDGDVEGRVLSLPGDPGWGVWYTTTKTPSPGGGPMMNVGVQEVTVYGAAGEVIASTRFE